LPALRRLRNGRGVREPTVLQHELPGRSSAQESRGIQTGAGASRAQTSKEAPPVGTDQRQGQSGTINKLHFVMFLLKIFQM